MTKKQYFQMVEKELEDLKLMIKKKNDDYTNADENSSPFENFTASAKLGICSAEQGLLLRLLDKVQRIKTYILNGKLSVENEGYKDAIRDVLGYSLLLMGMLHEKEEEHSVVELPKAKIKTKSGDWE